MSTEDKGIASGETPKETVESVPEKRAKRKPALPEEKLRLLKLRLLISRRRPHFTRMNVWQFKRLEDVWRSPRHFLDNKIRLQRKGFPPMVKVGYRGPRAVRGLHPSGFEEVLVSSVKDLLGLDPAKHAIRISAKVGKKKRGEIIKKAEELGFRILNAGG